MATPHAAGAVALYLGKFPKSTPEQVHNFNCNRQPGLP